MIYKVVYAFLLFSLSLVNASPAIEAYRHYVQQRIDTHQPVSLEAFVAFHQNLENYFATAQRLGISKEGVQNMISFLKKLTLLNSVITANTVPEYAESFTVSAVASINDKLVPIKFTVVADVQLVDFYSISFMIPNDISLASYLLNEFSFIDTLLKDRWITFSLIDFKDTDLGMLKTGLNFSGQMSSELLRAQFPAAMNVIEQFVQVPSIRFWSYLPLDLLSFIPFFTTGTLPSTITLQKLQSLINLRATLEVSKALYTNQMGGHGIQSVTLESLDLIMRYGVSTSSIVKVVETVGNMSLGIGATTRITASPGENDLRVHGLLELTPTGPLVTGSLQGVWHKPFGMRWLTLHDVGFDFPLLPTGIALSGIGMRARAAFGNIVFECAGKSSVVLLSQTGLLLHANLENLSINNVLGAFGAAALRADNPLAGIQLDHARITLALGDVVVAGRTFKTGLVVKGQVSNTIFDKKAGFEFIAYDSGSYYQLFGNAYLPQIQTPFITFDRADTNSAYAPPVQQAVGPRVEFEYAYDPVLQIVPLMNLRANGLIKIGSLFEGVADLDLSSLRIINPHLLRLRTFFMGIFKKQRIVLRGKIFNTFGAEVMILDSKDDDVYLKIAASQKLLSAWELPLRQAVSGMRQKLKKQLELIEQKIENLKQGMSTQAQEALERAAALTAENKSLQQEIDQLGQRRKKLSWVQSAKALYVASRQVAHWVTLRSNADLINTILMHGSVKESAVEALAVYKPLKKMIEAVLMNIEKGVQLGSGVLGIEKIQAQTWLRDFSERGELLITIEMKVMGQTRIISDVPLKATNPLGSFERIIHAFLEELFNVKAERHG